MTTAQAPCAAWLPAWRPSRALETDLFADSTALPDQPRPESLEDADATAARGTPGRPGSLGRGGRRPSGVGTGFMLLRKLGSDLAPGSKGPWSHLLGDAGWQDQGSPYPPLLPRTPTPPLSPGSFSAGSHQGPWSSLQIPSPRDRSRAEPLECDKLLPSGNPRPAGKSVGREGGLPGVLSGMG